MNRFLLVVTCLSTLSLLPTAHASKDVEQLIKGCKEIVGIYARKDEKRMLADLTTSSSEALLAGYCIGVAEEYRRNHSCFSFDWFVQAQRIAETPVASASRKSVEELLKVSCAF